MDCTMTQRSRDQHDAAVALHFGKPFSVSKFGPGLDYDFSSDKGR